MRRERVECMKYLSIKWIYLGVVMIAGAVCGSLFLQMLSVEQQASISNEISLYLNWIQQSGNLNDGQIFWTVFFKYVVWAGLLFVLGISVIGVPIIIMLNFLKGFLIGAAFHTIILTLGSKGIVVSLVSILPQNMIVVPAILLLSSAGIGFSVFIVKNRLIRHQGYLKEQLMSYSTVAMSMLLLLAVASWIEVYVSPKLLVWYMEQNVML